MKNSWLVWLFIVGVVITVLVAFNYQGGRSAVPLSEIFPGEQAVPIDIAYEFMDEKKPAATTQQPITQQSTTAKESPAPVTMAQPAQKTSVTPTTTIPATREIKIENAPFTIQVGSFKTRAAAETSLKRVLEKGYEGYVVSKDLGAQGTWHRIYVGTFQTRSQAEQGLTKIKADYPSSFIISPK
jgi:cell division septation protein DedD